MHVNLIIKLLVYELVSSTKFSYILRKITIKLQIHVPFEFKRWIQATRNLISLINVHIELPCYCICLYMYCLSFHIHSWIVCCGLCWFHIGIHAMEFISHVPLYFTHNIVVISQLVETDKLFISTCFGDVYNIWTCWLIFQVCKNA